ncbi:MAG: oxygen-dependent coproporphyrinogen oxidase [Myxococcales bacterium]
MSDRFRAALQAWQDEVSAALERLDGARFRKDSWQRPGGGGGRSRVLQAGAVFERAGVNYSDVFGELPEDVAKTFPGEGLAFRASGVSLVFHPRNPMAPITHANFRVFERGDTFWFGGGADLTPTYLFDEDARHFHATLKAACDRHDPTYYPRFKKWCDEYFFIRHRGETRGVGGIFFDHLSGDRAALEAFAQDAWRAFLPAYLPLVERRKDAPFGERERTFQLLRRGRYVEFNLVYDRGTVFGLKTGGRIESILMSLPPLAGWEYDFRPEPGSEEERLLAVLRAPRAWVEGT